MAEQVGKFLTELPELTSPSDSNLMYVVDGDTSKKATLGNLKKIVGGDVTGAKSGAIVSFSDGADDAPLEALSVEINPTQSGSGTPSPSNVRAISGYTSVNVNVSGKNLFNVNAPQAPNAALDSNGEWTASNYYNGFVFKGGFVYTLSMTKGSGFDTLRYAVRTGGTGARQTYNMDAPLVIDATLADEVRIVLGKNDFATNVQLEIGTGATAYEAYAGNTTTTALGQTVYGGRLNVLTGELTIDRAIITITDETQFTTFSADSTYGSLVTIASDGKADSSNIMSISDMALGISNNDRVSPDYVSLDRCYIDDNGRVRLRASKDVTISTKADMLARFLNAQVVYILATPLNYTLTLTEVRTILGANNISADSGDVDLVYVRDLNIVINDLIDRVTALENE